MLVTWNEFVSEPIREYFFSVLVTTSNFLSKMSAVFDQKEYFDCRMLVTRCMVVTRAHTHTHTHAHTHKHTRNINI
jgi:hypothetical protein